MRRIACIFFLLALLCCSVHSRERNMSAGATFAGNEFSLEFGKKVSDNLRCVVNANLDMNGVFSGKYDSPGISFDFIGQFVFASKKYGNGEVITGYAGPGVTAGYVRGNDGLYGLMAGVCGEIGMEYAFNVPVSLSLSLAPVLGVTVCRPEDSINFRMGLYEYGLIASLMPRIGIKYRF